MTRSVYIASPEGLTGKSAIAVGLLDALTREVGSVGIFRPLTHSAGDDLIVDLMVSQPGVEQTYDEALGVTYDAARHNPDEAMHTIVERFGQLTDRYEAVIILGSDYTDISTGTELSRQRPDRGQPWITRCCWWCTDANAVPRTSGPPPKAPSPSSTAHHAQTVALIANRVRADDQDQIVKQLHHPRHRRRGRRSRRPDPVRPDRPGPGSTRSRRRWCWAPTAGSTTSRSA